MSSTTFSEAARVPPGPAFGGAGTQQQEPDAARLPVWPFGQVGSEPVSEPCIHTGGVDAEERMVRVPSRACHTLPLDGRILQHAALRGFGQC